MDSMRPSSFQQIRENMRKFDGHIIDCGERKQYVDQMFEKLLVLIGDGCSCKDGYSKQIIVDEEAPLAHDGQFWCAPIDSSISDVDVDNISEFVDGFEMDTTKYQIIISNIEPVGAEDYQFWCAPLAI